MLRLLLLLAVSALAAPLSGRAPPPPAAAIVRPDVLLLSAQLAVRGGALVEVTSGGTAVSQRVSLVIIQVPEGISDADYACSVTWSSVVAGAVPVDVARWPEVWSDGAWRLDTSAPPTTGYGGCGALDPSRLGADPLATLAAAGWNLGFGPLTPKVSLWCEVKPWTASSTVVVYAWMDGARPFPVGAAVVEAIDAAGELTGDRVPGASTALTSPAGLYTPLDCTIPTGL